MMVSQFDRLLVIRRDGSCQVIDAPEKEFVGKGCSTARSPATNLRRSSSPDHQEDVQVHVHQTTQITSFQLKKLYPTSS